MSDENVHNNGVEHRRNSSIDMSSPSFTSTVQHVVSRFTIRDNIAFDMFCARVKQNGEEQGMLKNGSGNHGDVDCDDIEMRYWDYEEEDWIMVTCDADWTVAKWRLAELCSPPSATSNSFMHFQHRLIATGSNTAADNRGSCSGNGSDHTGCGGNGSGSNLFPPPLMRQRSYQHRVLRVVVRPICDSDNQKQRAEAMYSYLKVLKQALVDDAASMVYGGGNGGFGRFVVDPSPPTSPIFRRLSQGEPSLMSPNSQLQRMRTMSLPVFPKIVDKTSTQETMLASIPESEPTPIASTVLSTSLPSSNMMIEMTDEDSEEEEENMEKEEEEVPAISLRRQQASEGIPPQSPQSDRIQKRKNRRRRRSNGKARHERVLSGHIIFDDSERSHLNNFMLYHDPYGSDSSNSSNSDYCNSSRSIASPSHGIDLAA